MLHRREGIARIVTRFVRPPEQNQDCPFFHRSSRLESRAVAKVSVRGEPEALSSCEREVLRYLVRGYSFAEAASSLGLRVFEVKRICESICKKLDLRGRPTVYEYAVAVGLVGRSGKA